MQDTLAYFEVWDGKLDYYLTQLGLNIVDPCLEMDQNDLFVYTHKLQGYFYL